MPLARRLALHHLGARQGHQPPIEAEGRDGEGSHLVTTQVWDRPPPCPAQPPRVQAGGPRVTHQSGEKSEGAWMSHSSLSGPVSASKERRAGLEAGGVTVKLGGQENRAATAGKTGLLSLCSEMQTATSASAQLGDRSRGGGAPGVPVPAQPPGRTDAPRPSVFGPESHFRRACPRVAARCPPHLGVSGPFRSRAPGAACSRHPPPLHPLQPPRSHSPPAGAPAMRAPQPAPLGRRPRGPAGGASREPGAAHWAPRARVAWLCCSHAGGARPGASLRREKPPVRAGRTRATRGSAPASATSPPRRRLKGAAAQTCADS